MKIEPGKKYRVKDMEKSELFTISLIASDGDEVTPVLEAGEGFWELDNGYVIDEICLGLIEDEQQSPESTSIQPIAENLWQTLCYVKQALDSGAPIDKEYIAKVLAENRPEEKEEA